LAGQGKSLAHDRVPSSNAIPGTHHKLLLANLPKPEQRMLITRLTLTRHGPHTTTSKIQGAEETSLRLSLLM
jgi:hypothetical protein